MDPHQKCPPQYCRRLIVCLHADCPVWCLSLPALPTLTNRIGHLNTAQHASIILHSVKKSVAYGRQFLGICQTLFSGVHTFLRQWVTPGKTQVISATSFSPAFCSLALHWQSSLFKVAKLLQVMWEGLDPSLRNIALSTDLNGTANGRGEV